VLGFVMGVERTGRWAEWEVPRGRGDITGVDIVSVADEDEDEDEDKEVDVAGQPLLLAAVQGRGRRGRRVRGVLGLWLGYRIMKYGPPWRWCDWRGHAVRATGEGRGT
jgi:hypothetical protein